MPEKSSSEDTDGGAGTPLQGRMGIPGSKPRGSCKWHPRLKENVPTLRVAYTIARTSVSLTNTRKQQRMRRVRRQDVHLRWRFLVGCQNADANKPHHVNRRIWEKTLDEHVKHRSYLAGENMRRLHSLLWGQCTDIMHEKLEAHESFAGIFSSVDGLGFLNLVKGVAFLFRARNTNLTH